MVIPLNRRRAPALCFFVSFVLLVFNCPSQRRHVGVNRLTSRR
jgi:hypothetical protein